MDPRFTRRSLLRVAGAAGAAWGLGGVAAGTQAAESSFSPVEHGYGFRNWSPKDQYFESPPAPEQSSVRQRIRSAWRDPLRAAAGVDPARFPRRLVDAIAAQVRTAVAQYAGTNGHCYGMVLTAQRYFEDPDAIPVDRPKASAIEAPTVPVETPEAPVYEEIVRRQAQQYLRPRSWLGRRAVLYPDRIDTERVIRDVAATIEEFGSAAVTIFDGSLLAHQVLAYGVEETDWGVRIPIYDPNRSAKAYEGRSPALRFERDGDGLSMRQYQQYTGVLFNRFDQIDRAVDREASPLDHLTVGADELRSSLFPFALVTVDSGDVELVVCEPDGTEVGRLRGTAMDRTRGEHARMRSLYGAPAGTYQIGVLATAPTDYELSATVVGPEGTVVDETRTGTLEAGQHHRFDLEVPEDGEGEVERTSNERRWPAIATAGTVGGVAAGALGYRSVQDRTDADRE